MLAAIFAGALDTTPGAMSLDSDWTGGSGDGLSTLTSETRTVDVPADNPGGAVISSSNVGAGGNYQYQLNGGSWTAIGSLTLADGDTLAVRGSGFGASTNVRVTDSARSQVFGSYEITYTP